MAYVYEDKFYRLNSSIFFNPKRELYYFRFYNTEESVYQLWCVDIDNMPTLICSINDGDVFEMKLSTDPDNIQYSPLTYYNYERNIGYKAPQYINYPDFYLTTYYAAMDGNVVLSHISGDTYNHYYKDQLLESPNIYHFQSEPISAAITSGYLYDSTSTKFENTALSGDTFTIENGTMYPYIYHGGDYSDTPMLLPINGMELI